MINTNLVIIHHVPCKSMGIENCLSDLLAVDILTVWVMQMNIMTGDFFDHPQKGSNTNTIHKKETMMQIAKVTAITCITVLYFLMSVCAAQKAPESKIIQEADAQQYQLISISSFPGLSPESVTIQSGTTVIWRNISRKPMEVLFTGKAVTMACKSPIHFIVDEKGSFLSNRIPNGAVASLCFIQPGEFDYSVRTVIEYYRPDNPDRPREAKGKIIVTK